MSLMLPQYLKLRETYWKTTSSQNMALVTSHVILNIFFWKGMHTSKKVGEIESNFLK